MQVDRTILWRSGALGDFVLTLPLLRALVADGRRLCLLTRRRYAGLLPPGCNVEMMLDVEAPQASVLFGPRIDAAAALPPAFAAEPTRPPSPANSAPRSWGELLTGAEALLFIKPDARVEANLRNCGVRNVTWIEPRPSAPPHAARRFLEAAGFTAPAELIDAPLWPLPTAGRSLWLHPGSGSPAKNHPPGDFARLAASWQARHHADVIVSFGEADEELAPAITAAFAAVGVRWRPVRDVTPLELLQLLRKDAALYIGNDSGVTHLAGAAGIPTIALFRTTDPAVWRPLGRAGFHGE